MHLDMLFQLVAKTLTALYTLGYEKFFYPHLPNPNPILRAASL